MYSAKHNLTMDKATGLIFSLFDVASCLFVNRSMYNARTMDVPLSSFAFQFLLLTKQGVDLQ